MFFQVTEEEAAKDKEAKVGLATILYTRVVRFSWSPESIETPKLSGTCLQGRGRKGRGAMFETVAA